MEELSTWWKKLTLSELEENWVALRSDRKKSEFVLAGKFFTCRTLNIEAVTKILDLYGTQKVVSMSLLVVKIFYCLLLNWNLMLKELFKVNLGLLTDILLSLKDLMVILLFTRWVSKRLLSGCKFIIYLLLSKLLRQLSVLVRLLVLLSNRKIWVKCREKIS